MGAQITSATVVDTVFMPIGGVCAWLKNLGGHTPALPTAYVECNGQVINDAESPYNGDTVPDLNSNWFLRGGATSGTTGGADSVTIDIDHIPAHTHTYPSFSGVGTAVPSLYRDNGGAAVQSSSTGGGQAISVVPKYYQVVWVMRIK